VNDNKKAPDDRVYARTGVFKARAHMAIAPAVRGGRSGMYWRVLLLGMSGAGSLASIACLISGHAMLALRIFTATIFLLGTLILLAIL